MPYSSTAELPAAVKSRLKSPTRMRQWMHVFNSEMSAHGDERRAFASAWAAAERSQAKPKSRTRLARGS